MKHKNNYFEENLSKEMFDRILKDFKGSDEHYEQLENSLSQAQVLFEGRPCHEEIERVLQLIKHYWDLTERERGFAELARSADCYNLLKDMDEYILRVNKVMRLLTVMLIIEDTKRNLNQ